MQKVQKNGKGRTKGIKLPKRPKYPIVKKHKKTPKQRPEQLNRKPKNNILKMISPQTKCGGYRCLSKV